MKKIVIDSQSGINPHYKQWSKEAVQEFLSLFPEYKDSFSVVFRDDQSSRIKEISQSEYDALPVGTDKSLYVFSNGKWLVPYESMEWTLAYSKKISTINAPDKTDLRALMSLQATRIRDKAPDEVVVSLINGQVEPFCFGYAYEQFGSVLAVDLCSDKEFFKTIFIHELGHVFRATHQQRPHTIVQNGEHCTNNLCIMGASNYQRLSQERLTRRANNQPPFCDECIASMREYMSHMPELTRRVQSEQRRDNPQENNNDVLSEIMPVLPHNNNDWKKSYRDFYKQVSQRNNAVYKEKETSQNYLAQIKRQDGSCLNIEANNDYHVALSAKKPDGQDDIPSLEDMKDLVKLAKSKHCGMNFSKKNEPEFNARLMIACLEEKPQPLEMKNQPALSREFLNSLKKETRLKLQSLTPAPSYARPASFER